MRLDAKIPIIFKSKSELEDIIDDWNKHKINSFDDCGFAFKNDSSKIYWLSQSLARGKFNLDVSLDNNGIVENEQLFGELNKISNEILKLMDE